MSFKLKLKKKFKKYLKYKKPIYKIFSLFNHFKLKYFSGTHKEIFKDIYVNNKWGNIDSASGGGSTIAQTKSILQEMPYIFSKYKIKSILDLPCGDFNWMKEYKLNGISYLGGDIVPQLINKNIKSYSNKKLDFQLIDLLSDDLPYADLIFCRDCLVHFSYDDIFKALKNIKKTNFKFILTTNFVDRQSNFDIPTGSWRPINLCKPPFNFPKPKDIIFENCTEGENKYKDKTLSIWDVSVMPI